MVNRILRIALTACLLWGSSHTPLFAQTKSANPAHTASKPPQAAPAFAPLDQWKAAVISGDASKLRALYSTNPAARVILASGETSADTEVAFWSGLKARRS